LKQLLKTKVNIRKHIVLVLFFTLFLLPAGRGADITVPPDTTRIQIRVPDARNIAVYRNQKAFNYERKTGNNSISLMIRQWLYNILGRLVRLFDHEGSVELLLVILIALAVTAVILKVNNINPIALFRGKNRTLQPAFEIGKENIGQMDFAVLIAQATKQGNYRLAIRYHYLQTLAMLAMAGKIRPRDEKTNREYISELGNGETRNSFARLVYGFEFIWYGEFVPDEVQYLRLKMAFVSFQEGLQG
jgi:hypothetical protein